MAQVQNLDQNEEVSEGTFTWEFDVFLETKGMICSPPFRFGRSTSYLVLGSEVKILGPTFSRLVMMLLITEVPGGFSVFTKEILYNICLIDTNGQELKLAKGALFHDHDVDTFIPINFFYDDLRKKFQPEETATIRFSWCTRKKSSGHEQGTQTTQDLISEEPRSTFLEKLSDDLRFLYDNKSDTDCVLKIGNVQFPAHRALLSARSTVFAAMFQHETSEKLSGVVDIQDIEVAVLGDVLKYMYSGKIVGLTSETAASMYELADKYAIFELRDHCLCFLKNNMTIETVCDAAVLAHTHGEVGLEENVSQFIEDRLEDIQQSNAWKHFVNSNPLLAVKYLTSSFIAYKKNKKDEQK